MKISKKNLLIVLSLFVAFNLNAQINYNQVSKTNANVRVLQVGKINVHSYVNPNLIQVTSYVIELKDSLVIIDAQLTYTFTKEVLAYAQSLNKPIARVIITHSHPDHFLGAYAFKDYPVYALAETIHAFKQNGEGMRQVFLKNFGDKDAAPEVLIPSKVLKQGNTKINGIVFFVELIKDSEADAIALITIPKSNVFIAGDFLYNKVHLFPGFNHLANWQSLLQKYAASLKGKIVLPGHGYPSDSQIVKANIDYLTKAIDVAKQPNMNAANYKAEMIKAFPDYGAAILMDFGAGALFAK